MTTGVRFVAAMLAFGFGVSCGTPTPTREVGQYSIEQFMDITSIGGGSFSSDEQTILFSSNESGVFNAYSVPVAAGQPTQITHSTDDAIFAISFFPGDDRILYRSDQGGNEISHIYLREEDGTVTDLTPGDRARATFHGWSYDEQSFFYDSNARDPRFMDLYEIDIETLESEMIFQNDGYFAGPVSRDKRYVALVKVITTNDSDIYLYDVQTTALEHLTPHEGETNFIPISFSPDGTSLYYLTDEDSEFRYLIRHDLESDLSETIVRADWDVAFARLSRSGKYLVVAINNDARTEIKVYETATRQAVPLPELPEGVITAVRLSKSEDLMLFYHSGSRSPSNLYVYDLVTNEYRQLSDTMNPAIDRADLVETEVVRYKSFDDLDIPAILMKPHLAPGEKAPALVQVHGGPGGQSRTGYSPIYQYLVNHGYVVLRVNNRGSSGYGKTFFQLDDLKHGEDDLMDCVAAKDFLISTGYVDENRIGIIGGSYGGYMVLAALTFQPDAFAVGIDLFGISNWLRTLQNTPPWWTAQREALFKEMGNPDTDEEYLRRISPLFHADQIKSPLMVLQGANDPRVLKVESDEIVEAARTNGVPVQYLVFDDEGHGFVKKENQIRGYGAILDFLDEHLKGEAAE